MSVGLGGCRLLERAREQSKVKADDVVPVNESMLDARNPKLREVSSHRSRPSHSPRQPACVKANEVCRLITTLAALLMIGYTTTY